MDVDWISRLKALNPEVRNFITVVGNLRPVARNSKKKSPRDGETLCAAKRGVIEWS